MNLKTLQSSFKTASYLAFGWLNSLKSKITAFDIKPARPMLPEYLAQANLALEQGNLTEAEKCFQRVLSINPLHSLALFELAGLYLKVGRLQSAAQILHRAGRYYATAFDYQWLLGFLHMRQGNLSASAAAYARALAINPESVYAQHFVHATQQITTPIAPRSYIKDLFDNYATHYEKELLTDLSYRAHLELAEFINTNLQTDSVTCVVDLGCGTGLLGQELVQRFTIEQLIGVDLAIKMLTIAQERSIYTELHNQDILEYLQVCALQSDIIVASDVFVYIGDLADLFVQAHANLVPGGYFGFSVETLEADGYKLAPTGRYQHSLSYITSLQTKCGFSKIYSKTVALRKECGNIVSGYLVLLQK